MRPIDVIEGKVSVLDRADVDTDQIIPKQFLKRVERTGFGEFLFYDWIRDGEIELEPNPILVTGAQLRLRLLARARPLGAGGLRLRGDHRALLRRHLLLQLHQGRAAAGDPRRGALPRRRRGGRGADRRRRRDRHLRRRRLQVRDRARRQAPAAQRPRRHRHHAGERRRDRQPSRVRRRRARPGDDGALRPDERPDEHRPARVGRRDLRRDLRPPVQLGDGGARAARAAAATRPCSTPAAARAGSPSELLERLPDGQRDRRRRLRGDDRRRRASGWATGAAYLVADLAELELERAGRPGLLDRDLPLDPRPRPPLRGACARRCARAAGWSPSAAARATSPSTRRRSPTVAAAARVRRALRGDDAGSGTSPAPEETEARLRGAGFAEVRCWLEPKPVAAARARSSSLRPSPSARTWTQLPEELRRPFAEAILEQSREAARRSTTSASTSRPRAARLARPVECRRRDSAPRIVLLPGDGIGPEIVGAARRLLEALGEFEFERAADGRLLDRRPRHRAHRRGARRLPRRRRGPARRRRRAEMGHDRPRRAAPRAGPARPAQGHGPLRQPAPGAARARPWSAPARCARSGSPAPTCWSSAS